MYILLYVCIVYKKIFSFVRRTSSAISWSVKTRIEIHKLNFKFIRRHTRATYFYWLLIQFRCEEHNKQQRRLISPACGACDKSKAHRYTLTAIKRNPAGPFSFCFSISTQWETRFFLCAANLRLMTKQVVAFCVVRILRLAVDWLT